MQDAAMNLEKPYGFLTDNRYIFSRVYFQALLPRGIGIMTAHDGEATIDEAISRCIQRGSSECMQELSELIMEQEHLLENKFLLYKLVIKHLMMRNDSRTFHS